MNKFLKNAIILLSVLWAGNSYGSMNIDYRPYTPYDSLISHELELYGLPSNFRFLPLLLTECNERFSNEYAAGPWALSAAAAHHYGLLMTPGYDERHDMRSSTLAAAAYLADLYVLNNCDSEKTLQQFAKCAPKIQSNKDVSLDFLLSRMEVGYNNSIPHASDSISTRTAINLRKTVRIGEFCRLLEIDSTALVANNPCIRPKSHLLYKDSRIYIPSSKNEVFNATADSLYAHAIDESKTSRIVLPTERPAPLPKYIVYRVKSGDTLGHIALRYGVGVSQIKRWNKLRSDMLQIGQRLKIYQ